MSLQGDHPFGREPGVAGDGADALPVAPPVPAERHLMVQPASVAGLKESAPRIPRTTSVKPHVRADLLFFAGASGVIAVAVAALAVLLVE